MTRHHKTNKRKLRRRVTTIYEPMGIVSSHRDFVRTVESFTRKAHGRVIRNPDGSITSVSPFGEIITAIYGEPE